MQSGDLRQARMQISSKSKVLKVGILPPSGRQMLKHPYAIRVKIRREECIGTVPDFFN